MIALAFNATEKNPNNRVKISLIKFMLFEWFFCFLGFVYLLL